MQTNPLDFDEPTLRAANSKRHGVILGQVVSDATISLRQLENARHAELAAELATVHEEMSVIKRAAGERRASSKAKLEAAHAAYVTLCTEDAALDSAEQTAALPLTARSIELQQAMRGITQPRLTERELQAIASYSSPDAERLRAADKKLPPPAAPPLDELAQINLSRSPLGLKAR